MLSMKDYITLIGDRIGWSKEQKGSLAYWRERILLFGYLLALILGGISAIGFSTGYQIQEHHFFTALIEICGFAWVIAVLLSKGRISYFFRSVSAIGVVVLAALITLYEVGPRSVASAELVSVCVFSALFFGIRGTVISITMIGLTLIAAGLLLSSGGLPWGAGQMDPARFPAWSLWLLLWSSLSSVGTALLVTGLEQAIFKEQGLRDSLEEKVLQRTRELLETIQRLKDENARRRQAEKETMQTMEELQKAGSEINLLQGLLPICSSCKRIRDDSGYWEQIESYVQSHSNATFTHGICPECSDQLYGKEDWYIDMKKEKGL